MDKVSLAPFRFFGQRRFSTPNLTGRWEFPGETSRTGAVYVVRSFGRLIGVLWEDTWYVALSLPKKQGAKRHMGYIHEAARMGSKPVVKVTSQVLDRLAREFETPQVQEIIQTLID